MKTWLSCVIKKIIHRFFFTTFIRAIAKATPDKHIYFIDLDNTIADTWPTLVNNIYANESERLASLAVFIGMRKKVLDILSDERNFVLFVSARSYFSLRDTRDWIKSIGIILPQENVIIVGHPMDKLDFIQYAIKKGFEITYIDDLSYNHERGVVKYHYDVINKVRDLGISYLNLNEIALINKNCNAD